MTNMYRPLFLEVFLNLGLDNKLNKVVSVVFKEM